jgi:hypothetical protein
MYLSVGLLHQYKRKVVSHILMAVAINSYVFWNMALCSRVRVSRSFGGLYRLHLQD